MEQKNAVISITGMQSIDQEDKDTIQLITDGTYSFGSGVVELSYMESELTGMEGTQTIISVRDGEVVMTREGSVNSRMIFSVGQKHTFLYDTPYGSATMGLDTFNITSTLGPVGGDMEINYVVDVDHAVVGRNTFRINVRTT